MQRRWIEWIAILSLLGVFPQAVRADEGSFISPRDFICSGYYPSEVSIGRAEDIVTDVPSLCFPLRVGNYWTYSTGRTEAIVDSAVIAGHTYYRFDAFPYSAAESPLYRLDERNRLVEWFYEQDVVQYCLSLLPGDTWIGYSWELGRLLAHVEDVCASVTVPAGTFLDCLHLVFVRHTENQRFLEEWIAPGVGIVKRVKYGVHEDAEELVEAEVNGVHYPTGANVSVPPATCACALPSVEELRRIKRYFPLRVGNTWKYAARGDPTSRFTLTQTITDTVVMDGKTYYRFDVHSTPQGYEFTLYSQGTERLYGMDKRGRMLEYVDGKELVRYRFDVDLKDRWVWPSPHHRFQVFPSDFADTVSVTAGTFEDCLFLNYLCAGADCGFGEWLAPDVGPVKFYEVTFGGYEKWELIAAEVNGIHYPRPARRFEHDVALNPHYYVRDEKVGLGGTLEPKVMVWNVGIRDESACEVICRIERDGEEVYRDTRIVRDLKSGQMAQVAFEGWSPGHVGAYQIVYYTALPEDGDASNDTLRARIAVPIFMDVSAAAGLGGEGKYAISAAVGDYDNDGDLDIYLGHSGDVLYRNNGDGTFTDVTSVAMYHPNRGGHAVVFGDLDNDGALDLYIANRGRNRFFRNNGDGTFTDATSESGLDDARYGRGLALADYDSDGDLDIYVGNFDIGDHGRNLLYRNNGDGTFTDVADAAGVTRPEFTTSASFGDYDGDGHLDLCVTGTTTVSDTGLVLYRNNGDGTFTDVTVSAYLGYDRPWMSSAFGDYDNDGDLDLHLIGDLSSLYRNGGDGTFSPTGEAGYQSVFGHGRDTSFGDYDNDGDLDLLMAHTSYPHILFYRNGGDGTFTDITFLSHVESPDPNGRRAILADYDGDGDLDLYLVREGGGALYRNESEAGNWLKVKLIGRRSNRDGIGAKVIAVAGRLRQIRGGRCSSKGGGSLTPVHFGLGDRTSVDSVIVRWPSSIVDRLLNVPADQVVTIREGDTQTAIKEEAKRTLPTTYALHPNVPNPFNDLTVIPYDVPEPERVRLSVYNLLGQEVRVLVDDPVPAGHHIVRWDGQDDEGHPLASGIYLCRLRSGSFTHIHKMALIR